MIGRRSFLASLAGLTGALVLPEPARVRAYSFMPGERFVAVTLRDHFGTYFGTTAQDCALGDWVTLNAAGLVVPARVADPIFGRVVRFG